MKKNLRKINFFRFFLEKVYNSTDPSDDSAYIMLANRRFSIDKAAFDAATDKTRLSFNYSVVAGDHLINRDFVVNSTHLSGVSDSAGVAVNDLDAELVLLKNSDVFVHKTGADNPLSFLQSSNMATSISVVKFVDLDNNGVDEMVYVSERGIQYFKIQDQNGAPVFTEIAQTDNHFANVVQERDIPTMAFGDVDKDGDLDMLISRFYYLPTKNGYYINNGSRFVLSTDSSNPFLALNLTQNYLSLHVLVDLDNDGDVDLVTSPFDSILRYYENVNGVYRENTSHILAGLDAGRIVRMDFTDLDQDGDLDLIAGKYYAYSGNEIISYYENTGTIDAPIFSQQSGDDNFFDKVDHDYIRYGVPAFNDVNGDGILDLVSARGKKSGELLAYYEGSNIVKVKTTHYQDMDGITVIDASDKITEHFAWNGLKANGIYTNPQDTTITNFDLSNDTLDVATLLSYLDDAVKLEHVHIRTTNNDQDSILSVDSLDVTLTGVSSDLDNLLSSGALII